MNSVQLIEGGPIQLVPMDWACGLENLGILSLMNMPNLFYFHGSYLWLDNHIYVDVELIFSITGLPKAGIIPTPFFTGKEQDTNLVSRMKEKHNLARDKRGFSISSINDTSIWFAKK